MVQLFKSFLLILFLFSSLNAKDIYTEEEIKKLIGKTIIIGFDSFSLNTQLKEDIKQYNLGGILLFSKDYKTKQIKNIKSPKQLDKVYPGTLSYNINTKLLRKELKFKGLIVSDDLQMKAISNHYTLKQTLKLAINSGINILVFGNQLGNIKLETIVNTIFQLIQEEEIPLSKILESNRLINKFLLPYSI